LESSKQLASHPHELRAVSWPCTRGQSSGQEDQYRPMANTATLADMVLELLGDKEERDIATQNRKILKGRQSVIFISKVLEHCSF